jgi:1-phosphatidylinositol-4-phosphate 5-kinase
VFLAYYFPIFGLGNIDNEVIYKYFEIVIVLFAGQIYAFAFVNLSIQLFICIDFYLTLRNPFFPRHRRGRCQGALQSMLYLGVIGMYIRVISKQSIETYEAMNLTLFVAKIVMILVGWVYILLSLAILFRKGTNQKLRNIALRRQFTFLFLFLFWHTMFSIFFYDSNLLKKINLIPLSQSSIRFISIYMQVIGIPSALLRLSEPFVWFKIKQSTLFFNLMLQRGCRLPSEREKKMLKNRSKDMKQQLSNASLCSFLNSAMNIEYVNLILQCIDKLMENQALMDSISRCQSELLRAQMEAMKQERDETQSNTQRDEVARLKLLRQRQKTITFEKDHTATKFTIHDVNFDNVDDWDLLNQYDSDNSINSGPLNPNLAERSIREIIANRKSSLAKRLTMVQRNPLSEHTRGSQASHPVKMSIKSNVIAHCMEKFQVLLDLDNIEFEDIQESLSVLKNRNQVFQAGEGQGKSGSFFFYSHDRKFIVKTLLKDEKGTFLRMLDQYIDHIVHSDNKSLLVRVYGLYTIQSSYYSNLDVILMENLARNFDKANVPLYTFDLKGSVINRRDPVAKGRVLKCLNFVDINESSRRLVRLDINQTEQLYDVIERDSFFLRRMEIMDYSMLMVIEQVTSKVQAANRFENLSRNEYKSCDNSLIYHVGLIDFLQHYTLPKRAEHYLKAEVLMRTMEKISCVPPAFYQERFMNFIQRKVLDPHKSDSLRVQKCAKVLDYKEFMKMYKQYHAQHPEEMSKLRAASPVGTPSAKSLRVSRIEPPQKIKSYILAVLMTTAVGSVIYYYLK